MRAKLIAELIAQNCQFEIINGIIHRGKVHQGTVFNPHIFMGSLNQINLLLEQHYPPSYIAYQPPSDIECSVGATRNYWVSSDDMVWRPHLPTMSSQITDFFHPIEILYSSHPNGYTYMINEEFLLLPTIRKSDLVERH